MGEVGNCCVGCCHILFYILTLSHPLLHPHPVPSSNTSSQPVLVLPLLSRSPLCATVGLLAGGIANVCQFHCNIWKSLLVFRPSLVLPNKSN